MMRRPPSLPPIDWDKANMEVPDVQQAMKAVAFKPPPSYFISSPTGGSGGTGDAAWIERKLESAQADSRAEMGRRWDSFEQGDRRFKEWVQREQEQVHGVLQQVKIASQEGQEQQKRQLAAMATQAQQMEFRVQELESGLVQAVSQAKNMANALQQHQAANSPSGSSQAKMACEALRHDLDREMQARTALAADLGDKVNELQNMLRDVHGRQEKAAYDSEQQFAEHANMSSQRSARVAALEPELEGVRNELETMREQMRDCRAFCADRCDAAERTAGQKVQGVQEAAMNAARELWEEQRSIVGECKSSMASLQKILDAKDQIAGQLQSLQQQQREDDKQELFDTLQNNVSTLQARLAEVEAAVVSEKGQRAEVRRQLEDKVGRIGVALERAQESWLKDSEKCFAEIRELRHSVASTPTAVEEQQRKNRRASEAVDASMQRQLDDLDASLTALRASLAAAEERTVERARVLDGDLRTVESRVSQRIADMQAMHASKMSQQDFEQRNTFNAQLLEQSDRLRRELAREIETSVEHGALRLAVDRLRQELVPRLENTERQSREQERHLGQRCSDAVDAITQLRADMQRGQEEARSASERSLEAVLAEVEAVKAFLETFNEACRDEIARRAEISADSIDTLRKELQSLEAQVSDLVVVLEAKVAVQVAEELHRESDQHAEDIEVLRRRLASHEETTDFCVEDLRAQLEGQQGVHRTSVEERLGKMQAIVDDAVEKQGVFLAASELEFGTLRDSIQKDVEALQRGFAEHEEKTDGSVQAFRAQVEEQIEGHKERTDGSVQAFQAQMEERIAGHEGRTDSSVQALRAQLEEQLARHEETTTGSVQALCSQVEEQHEAHRTSVDERFVKLQAGLDEALDTVGKQGVSIASNELEVEKLRASTEQAAENLRKSLTTHEELANAAMHDLRSHVEDKHEAHRMNLEAKLATVQASLEEGMGKQGVTIAATEVEVGKLQVALDKVEEVAGGSLKDLRAHLEDRHETHRMNVEAKLAKLQAGLDEAAGKQGLSVAVAEMEFGKLRVAIDRVVMETQASLDASLVDNAARHGGLEEKCEQGLADLGKELQTLRQGLDVASAEASSERSRLMGDIEIKMATYDTTFATQEAKNTALAEELRAMFHAQMKELSSDVESKIIGVETQCQEISDDLESKIGSVEAHCQELTGDLEKQLGDVEGKIRALEETKLRALEEFVKELESSLAVAGEESLRALDELRSEMKKAIEAALQPAQGDIEALDEQVQQTRSALSALEAAAFERMAEAETALGKHEDALASLASGREQHRLELERFGPLEKQLLDVQRQLDTLQSDLREQGRSQTAAQKTVQAEVASELESVLAALEGLRRQFSSLDSSGTDLGAAVDAVRRELDSEFKDMRSRLDSLSKRVGDRDAEHLKRGEDVKSRLESCDKSLESLQVELRAASDENKKQHAMHAESHASMRSMQEATQSKVAVVAKALDDIATKEKDMQAWQDGVKDDLASVGQRVAQLDERTKSQGDVLEALPVAQRILEAVVTDVGDLRGQLDALRRGAEDTQRWQDEAKGGLASLAERVDQLHAQATAQSGQLEALPELQGDLKAVLSDVADLRSQVDAQRRSTEEAQVATTSAAAAASLSLEQDMQAWKEGVQGQLASLSERIKQLDTQGQAESARLDDLSDLRGTVQRVSGDVEDLRGQVGELRQSSSKAQARQDAAQGDIDSITERLEQLDARAKADREKLEAMAELRDMLQQVSGQVDSLKGQTDALRARSEQAQASAHTQASSDLEAMRSEQSAALQAMEKKVGCLKAVQEEMQADINEFTTTVEDLIAKDREMQEQQEDARAKLKTLHECTEQLDSKLAGEARKIAELSLVPDDLLRVNSRVDALRDQLDDMSQGADAVASQVAELEAVKGAMDAGGADLRQKLEAMTQGLGELSSRVDTVQGVLEDAQPKAADLAQLEDRIKELVDDGFELRAHVDGSFDALIDRIETDKWMREKIDGCADNIANSFMHLLDQTCEKMQARLSRCEKICKELAGDRSIPPSRGRSAVSGGRPSLS